MSNALNQDKDQNDISVLTSKSNNKKVMRIIGGVIGGILISAITAYVTTKITINLQTKHEMPEIKILGAMPVHLYGSIKGPDNIDFRIHRLAFIFKLQNSSPTSTLVHTSMLEGCVPVDFLVSHSFDRDKKKSFKKTNINKLYAEYKNSVQRISNTGSIREDSRALPAYSVSYVGALYSFPTQGAYHQVNGSISVSGNCNEVSTVNPHPSLQQILEIQNIKQKPKGLQPGFESGLIKLSVFAGNDKILTDPSRILNLRSIRLDNWSNLDLPQMFENPDSSYPPVNKQD